MLFPVRFFGLGVVVFVANGVIAKCCCSSGWLLPLEPDELMVLMKDSFLGKVVDLEHL